MEKHLHIICFTIPYPVDYGGVVDLFWKLPYLQKQGIKIHLHCFEYNRKHQSILNNYCTSVHYYKRNGFLKSFFSRLPYIVSSRKSNELEKVLLQDNYPILCEGVHSTSILQDDAFIKRKIVIRLHNVEHQYYRDLYKATNHLFKKIYLFRESILLKKYENKIAQLQKIILTVTHQDALVYEKVFKATTVKHLPLFLPENWSVNCKIGKGNYCLYNGDLSVTANVKAVNWLLDEVISSQPNIQFIIAGKNPDVTIQSKTTQLYNVELVANPSIEKMEDLIQNAHINILPSYSSAGIKLKLLNALFNGRFCLVNNDTVAGSELDNLCLIANSSEEFINTIHKKINEDFTTELIEQRKLILTKKFNNIANAELLIENIFD